MICSALIVPGASPRVVCLLTLYPGGALHPRHLRGTRLREHQTAGWVRARVVAPPPQPTTTTTTTTTTAVDSGRAVWLCQVPPRRIEQRNGVEGAPSALPVAAAQGGHERRPHIPWRWVLAHCAGLRTRNGSTLI